MARGTAQALSQRLGQPFVVENRVGADSMIAGEACAKSPSDGYILCVSDSLGVALNPVIRSKMSYDPSRDLAPIIHYGYAVNAILVHPSVPANTLQELFALAKAKPGSIRWGSYGVASPSNIYVEWLNNVKGISFLNVPYKAASLAYPAMLAGQVDVAYFNLGQALPVIKAGKAKALAIVLPKRTARLPDVPTHLEGGMDIGIITTFGLYAPGPTPRAIIDRVNAEVAAGLFGNAEMKQKFLIGQGLELHAPAGGTPEEFTAFLKAERENFAKLVKIAKIKVE
jgi:tripartite-type tricarboxylate transporter receptor subunit TctC